MRIAIVILLASVTLRLCIQDDISYFISCFTFGLVYGIINGLLGDK